MDHCRWIVNRVREIVESEAYIDERRKHHFKRHIPEHAESESELADLYRDLKAASALKRLDMIANDCGTPLEEIRQIVEHDGYPQHLHLPPPNQYQMSALYEKVAFEASQEFGRKISKRNVKDCVLAWLKFERQISKAR
jgi:hypothetical protein